jgi:hypothetical protein
MKLKISHIVVMAEKYSEISSYASRSSGSVVPLNRKSTSKPSYNSTKVILVFHFNGLTNDVLLNFREDGIVSAFEIDLRSCDTPFLGKDPCLLPCNQKIRPF